MGRAFRTFRKVILNYQLDRVAPKLQPTYGGHGEAPGCAPCSPSQAGSASHIWGLQPRVSCIPLLWANPSCPTNQDKSSVPEEAFPASSVPPAPPTPSVWAGCPPSGLLQPLCGTLTWVLILNRSNTTPRMVASSPGKVARVQARCPSHRFLPRGWHSSWLEERKANSNALASRSLIALKR